MAITISSNPFAVAVEHNLDQAGQDIVQSAERISSGNRIVHGGDDPSGQALSSDLDVQIRSTNQARRNTLDAASMAQTAEGALNDISNILIRMRELAIQSSSDTVSDSERSYLEDEYGELRSEIDRLARSTSYNGNTLLDGSGKDLEIQVGTGNNELSRLSFSASQLDARTGSLAVDDSHVDDVDSAQSALDDIDQALDRLNPQRALLGAFQSRLGTIASNQSQTSDILAEARSRIQDTDVAEESAKLTSARIRERAAFALLAQANQSNESVLKLVGG